MSNFETFLSIGIALLAIASLIAVGWVVVRTKLAQTTIELQDKEIQALKQRLTTVESENNECKTKISSQENEIRTLERVVRHETEITHLIESLEQHRRADQAHHQRSEESFRAVLDRLSPKGRTA